MPKLLIEIDCEDPVRWMDLDLYHFVNLMEGMQAGAIDAEWKATVTDDNGEIIRESE